MAGGFGDQPPGIFGLLTLVDGEHKEALERDLIDLGLRLRDAGSPGFEWADLRAIVRWAPKSSALYRSMYLPDEDSAWGLQEMLLAAIADSLRWLQWAKTKDGARGRNMPEPIPRPGHRPKVTKHGGKASTPMDRARNRFMVPRLPAGSTEDRSAKEGS